MAVLDDDVARSCILIVDDDADMRQLLSRSLRRAGFWNVTAITGPEGVVEAFLKERPELLIIDYKLPPTDGLTLLMKCREHDSHGLTTPAIMLTSGTDPKVAKDALEFGVADFLRKDADEAELILRVRNVLRTHQLYLEATKQKTWLEELVRLRTTELFEARREVLERLATALDCRDDATGDHTRRVGKLAKLVALQLGAQGEFADSIEVAALLHDVGKISVPDHILLKPDSLTPEEREVVQGHCAAGAKLLQGSKEPVMVMAHEIALTHHERWDGKGYPGGLSATDIPLSGRIVAVIDSYDAMTNDRPYRKRMSHNDAIAEIIAGKGTQFDPIVVDAFLVITRSLGGFSDDNVNLADWLTKFS